MISLIAIWLAARPKSQKFSFGLHRAEVLGATLSVVMIWVVTGALVWNAKSRIQTGEYNVEAQTMLITSGLGVGATIIMAIALMTIIVTLRARSTLALIDQRTIAGRSK